MHGSHDEGRPDENVVRFPGMPPSTRSRYEDLLGRIAGALGTSTDAFRESVTARPDPSGTGSTATAGFPELASAFDRIRDPYLRRRYLDLLRAFGGS